MKSYLWGLVFILVGIFLIIQRTFLFDINLWNFIWPFFLIIPGITIHYNYFSKNRGTKNLILGGILTVYGFYFLFSILTNWRYVEYTNFIYPLGVGIGFFEDFAFEKHKNSFVISAVLIAVSIYMFLKSLNLYYGIEQYVLPIAFILLGIYILIKSRR